MILVFLFVFLAATILALIFSLNGLWQTLRTGLPFVTTPGWAIEWLKAHLPLSSTDIVYELGCGDARVITALAKQYPTTQFVGIEIQWWPYLLARWRTRNVQNARVIHGDIFKYDLAPATVVYGFYITGFVPRLAAQLREKLRPGARVISFGFSLPGWEPTQAIQPPPPSTGKSRLLMYQR